MNKNNFSLKNVMSNTLNSINGKAKRVFAVSTIQFVAFLLTYFLTGSLLVSFVVYSIFLPSQAKFLLNLQNAEIEDVFKIGKKFTTALLVSMLFVFLFGAGFVLLIFPAVILFANYALVFDIAKDGDKTLLQCFKQAREEAKGYRGKFVLLCLSFLLILILLVGVGILMGFLFSLFLPVLKGNSALFFSFLWVPKFYQVGVLLGVSLFLIFILPVEVLAVSKMREAIEQDKKYKENIEKVDNGGVQPKEEIKQDNKPDEELEDRNKKEPEDYIF